MYVYSTDFTGNTKSNWDYFILETAAPRLSTESRGAAVSRPVWIFPARALLGRLRGRLVQVHPAFPEPGFTVHPGGRAPAALSASAKSPRSLRRNSADTQRELCRLTAAPIPKSGYIRKYYNSHLCGCTTQIP